VPGKSGSSGCKHTPYDEMALISRGNKFFPEISPGSFLVFQNRKSGPPGQARADRLCYQQPRVFY
jgi:hypothetical protein